MRVRRLQGETAIQSLEIAKSPDSYETGDWHLNRGFRGDKGTRTPDPLHAMQVRYQLRHIPIFCYVPQGGNMNILHTPQRATQIEDGSNSKNFPKTLGAPSRPVQGLRSTANTAKGRARVPRMYTTCRAPNPPLTQALQNAHRKNVARRATARRPKPRPAPG